MVALTGFVPAPARASGDQSQPDVRPNVVLIVASDQRADTLQWMPILRARVAQRGVTFENAIAVTPGSDPGLAGLLSGRYASAHGVIAGGSGNAFDDEDTLATRLHAAGYSTAFVGKYYDDYHARAPRPARGWDVWEAFVDSPSDSGLNTLYYGYALTDGQGVRTYGTAASDYSTDVLAQRAAHLITTLPEPFLLVVAPFAPRFPAIPAPRHGDALDQLEAAPAFGGNVNGAPPYVVARRSALGTGAERAQRGKESAGATAYAALAASLDRRRELQSLLAIDEAVGSILDALAGHGLDDRTMVVYTATTGRLRGEHWGWSSEDPYEPSLRIPLVISLPGRHAARGQSEQLVANIDVRPTIEAAAGLGADADVDGKSLLAWWEDEPLQRPALLLQGWNGTLASKFAAPDFRGLRTAASKYVRYGDGFEELYDLAADPAETRNLAAGEDAEVERMRELLRTTLDDAERGRPRFEVVADAGFVRDAAPWFRRPFDVVAADMDLDGDPDVLVNWHHHEPLELYENRDGRFVLCNPRDDDPTGLYDNPGVPYLFADEEHMAAEVERAGIVGLVVWHDVNRGGFWRFWWRPGRTASGLVHVDIETTFPPLAIDGLEDIGLERPADNRLRVTLAADGSARRFSIQVPRVATELLLATSAADSAKPPTVFVGSKLVPFDGGRIDLWKPDPHGIAWVDVAGSARPDIYITRGALGGELVAPLRPKHDRFFVASDAVAASYRPAAPGAVPGDYTRGRRVEWVDVDADGALELWIAAERTPAELLARDDATETFRDRAPSLGLDLPDAAISAWGDLDQDGYADLFVLDGQRVDVMHNRGGRGFERVDGGTLGLLLPKTKPRPGVIEPASLRVSDFDCDGDLDLWVHAYGNAGASRLLRNDGPDGFVDATVDLGLDATLGSDAVVALDVDNDGFEDAVSLGPRSTLWKNHGGRRFTIVPLPVVGETARLVAGAAADFDGDGRTDVVAAGRGRQYLRNETEPSGNRYVDVELRAIHGEPIGAIVTAHYDDGSMRAQRYGSASGSAYSQSLLPLHFGIGAGRNLSEISVTWPGGARSDAIRPEPGRNRLVIEAPTGADPSRPAQAPDPPTDGSHAP